MKIELIVGKNNTPLDISAKNDVLDFIERHPDKFTSYETRYVLEKTSKQTKDFILDLLSREDIPTEVSSRIIYSINENIKGSLELIQTMVEDGIIPLSDIPNIGHNLRVGNIELAKILCADKEFPKERIPNILLYTTPNNNGEKNAFNTLRWEFPLFSSVIIFLNYILNALI